MERRNFLRTMLGVAAATALPSEVWPFRKIFLPSAPQNEFLWGPGIDFSRIDQINVDYWGLSRMSYPGQLGAFLITNVTPTTVEMVYQDQRPKVDLLVRRMKEAHSELLRKSLS